jgi:hypothetical protein
MSSGALHVTRHVEDRQSDADIAGEVERDGANGASWYLVDSWTASKGHYFRRPISGRKLPYHGARVMDMVLDQEAPS